MEKIDRVSYGYDDQPAPRGLAQICKLRKQGVGINKIARKLGIGVSVVQRLVAEGR